MFQNLSLHEVGGSDVLIFRFLLMIMKKRNPSVRFSSAHIKKMMQVDEDIGKMSHAVPAMVGKAVELFSTILVQKAGNVTKQKGAKTLTQEHVAAVIKEDPRFDFLVHLVKGVGLDTVADSDWPDKVADKALVKRDSGNEDNVNKNKLDKSVPKKSSQRLKNKLDSKNSLDCDIKLSVKMMPLQNQIVGPTPQVMQAEVKSAQMDEDYDL